MPQFEPKHPRPVNFARDVVEAAPPATRARRARAATARAASGRFGEIAAAAGSLAARLAAHGLRRGDVVMTLIGNRPEWVLTMVACFRLGLVVLPCTEQLRAKDLELRLRVADPRLVVVRRAQRRRAHRRRLGRPDALGARGASSATPPAPPHAELEPGDPCLITFTSGTAGEPKAVLHGQRYLAGQMLQARALARRARRRPRVVHRRLRLVEVGPQRVHRAVAARRGRAAARRALRPARAARAARARARRRACAWRRPSTA